MFKDSTINEIYGNYVCDLKWQLPLVLTVLQIQTPKVSTIGLSFSCVRESGHSCGTETYRKWLDPCDPSTSHFRATQKHHAGT